MRRNAVFQIEKTSKPIAFHLAKLGNGDKIVGPTDDRTHSDHNNIDQRVNHIASAGIGGVGKKVILILADFIGDMG